MIRLDGSTAPMMIEGPTDAEVFREYVRQVLVPSSRPGRAPASGHNDNSSRGAPRPTGQLWSKLKAFLRALKARTLDPSVDGVRDGF